MKKYIRSALLVTLVFSLAGRASLTNPVPVAGQHRTAQQKSAQQHESGVEKFLSEVI